MKSSTQSEKTLIKSIIENAVTATNFKAVYLKTSEPIAYPYCEFELKDISTIDGKTQQELEVNIYSPSQKTVEDIADELQDAFDHGNFENSDVAFYTYRNSRQNVDENDKNIKRLRLTFELNLYSRKA